MSSPAPTPEEKAREEAKRDRAWDPLQRWRVLQQTITWAEAQLPPNKRRNRPRRPILE